MVGLILGGTVAAADAQAAALAAGLPRLRGRRGAARACQADGNCVLRPLLAGALLEPGPARASTAAFAPQVLNGHVLDQTMWNHHFEAGTDRLTPGGLAHLQYLRAAGPSRTATVYLATANDIAYDPACPERYAGAKQELDGLRAAAIQKFLVAANGGRAADFQVLVHDPADVTAPQPGVGNSVQQMYIRFRGGLRQPGRRRRRGGGGAGRRRRRRRRRRPLSPGRSGATVRPPPAGRPVRPAGLTIHETDTHDRSSPPPPRWPSSRGRPRPAPTPSPRTRRRASAASSPAWRPRPGSSRSCVVVAAFALFIIMKKFSPDSRRAFAPKMNYARRQSEAPTRCVPGG